MLNILQMFVISAGGLNQLRYYGNEWKMPRYNVDAWDRVS